MSLEERLTAFINMANLTVWSLEARKRTSKEKNPVLEEFLRFSKETVTLVTELRDRIAKGNLQEDRS